MIKTVIFDIGNVLTYFQWEKFYRGFGFSETVYEKLVQATVMNEAWDELDRGKLTTAEVIDLFIKNAPDIANEIYQVFENVNEIVIKADHAIPWITSLKEKGYQVLVLSNFSEKVYEDCGEALSFLPYTDGGILSYKDKVVKPMPEIYQILLERYQLQADECVFVDDLQRNIDAAKKFGIHTVLFTEYEKAVEDLKELGVC